MIENNKVTALPDHIIEPQKGLGLMHGGVAGAGFDSTGLSTKHNTS